MNSSMLRVWQSHRRMREQDTQGGLLLIQSSPLGNRSHACAVAGPRPRTRNVAKPAPPPSGGDGDEPATVVQPRRAAELLREVSRAEEALVDAVPRPVVEHALLPLLGLDVLAKRRIDDHELRRDAPGLSEESRPLVALQVAVEVARSTRGGP